MKLATVYRTDKALQFSAAKEQEDIAKENLLGEVSKWIKYGEHYSLNIEKAEEVDPDSERFGLHSVRITATFEIIPQTTLHFVSPEEIHLIPNITFRKKLKNCVAYLKDKSGGEWRMK